MGMGSRQAGTSHNQQPAASPTPADRSVTVRSGSLHETSLWLCVAASTISGQPAATLLVIYVVDRAGHHGDMALLTPEERRQINEYETKMQRAVRLCRKARDQKAR